MGGLAFLSVASLAIILAISSVLVLWCKYEDGIIGKIALAALAVVSILVLWDVICNGVTYSPLPSTAWSHAAFALFLARHFFRFVRFHIAGRFAWRRRDEAGAA